MPAPWPSIPPPGVPGCGATARRRRLASLATRRPGTKAMPEPTPRRKRKPLRRMCRPSCLAGTGSMRSRRCELPAPLPQSSLPGCRAGSARLMAVRLRSGCGVPRLCPGACGRGARSGGGRQQRRRAPNRLLRPLRQRRRERRRLCLASGCSRPRSRRCPHARVPCRRSSAAASPRKASTIFGRLGPGRCRARCRRRMAGCRACGAAPAAAARPATPPVPRSSPGSRAVGPLGRQHLLCTPWCRTASAGDAAAACRRFGPSMRHSPAGRAAQCQSSPVAHSLAGGRGRPS